METTHTIESAIVATAIVHVDESIDDAGWFTHYHGEKNRMAAIEGYAGSRARVAKLDGNTDAYEGWRRAESAANVAQHAVNSAILNGGF